MKTPLDEWIEFSRAWLDERMAEQRARDEAAFARFVQKLFGPMG